MTTSNETICTQHGRASTYILHVHKVNTIKKIDENHQKIVQQKEQQHQHIDETIKKSMKTTEQINKTIQKSMNTIKKSMKTIEKNQQNLCKQSRNR